MKTSKLQQRRFSRGVLNHVYQRTVNRSLIFYCVSDYLVYYTLMCVLANKYHIRILMVSLMPDHIHLSIIASSIKDFSSFMRELTSAFSRKHNAVCHHDGAFFEGPFGSAPKYGDKNVRANLLYVGDNAPERKLVSKAEDYRWNFIAYAQSDHPFSQKLVVRRASYAMKKALSEIKATHKKGHPLSYTQLKRLFSRLDRKEKEQLTDYIITLYNVIDYKSAIRYFGSYEEMLTALHSNTGSEYDINEVFVGKSDAHYGRMVSICMKELNLKDIHDVLALDIDAKKDIKQMLMARTDALPEQIAAFLRIPYEKNRKV